MYMSHSLYVFEQQSVQISNPIISEHAKSMLKIKLVFGTFCIILSLSRSFYTTHMKFICFCQLFVCMRRGIERGVIIHVRIVIQRFAVRHTLRASAFVPVFPQIHKFCFVVQNRNISYCSLKDFLFF